MHVPTFATNQDFLGLGTGRAHAAPAESESAEPPPEDAQRERTPPGVPAGARFDLGTAGRVVPFLLLFTLASCLRGPECAGATPLPASVPSVSPVERAGAASARADSATPAAGSALAAAIRLRRAVDELAARVGRIDPEAFARPAGAGCAAACDLLGVKAIVFASGEARCSCWRLPNLGKHPGLNRNGAARAQAAELQALARPDGRVALAEGAMP